MSGDSSSSHVSQLLNHASETLPMKWAGRTTPYLPTGLAPDDEGKKAHLMLYSVTVGCIKNGPLRLIVETVSRDGREALRKLDAECRPTYRGSQMALLKRIVHPHLNSAGSDAEYIDNLSEWQQVVRQYERIYGKELDQTVKTTTLMNEAPPQLQEHLRLRSEEIGTDYKKVILAIEGYVRSKKTGDPGDLVDMDKGNPKIKGKSKGKGESDKGKGQHQGRGKGIGKSHEPEHNDNSDRKCFVCGKPGSKSQISRTAVPTLSSLLQLLRTSSLMVTTWKSERDGL